MARLRRRAGEGFFASLLDCFYCLSLWVAFPAALAIGDTLKERALLWLALSAAAILLERATVEKQPSTVYYEDPEEQDGMLRKD